MCEKFIGEKVDDIKPMDGEGEREEEEEVDTIVGLHLLDPPTVFVAFFAVFVDVGMERKLVNG